jgi:hypothetical protein
MPSALTTPYPPAARNGRTALRRWRPSRRAWLRVDLAAKALELEAACRRRRRWEAPPHRGAPGRALALGARMEGGVHVIREAVAAGTPVLASRASGNAGVPGAASAGCFPPGDTAELVNLIARAETGSGRYRHLPGRYAEGAPLFASAGEGRPVVEPVERCRCA